MNPTPTSQKAAARQFVEFWTGKGYEKGQTQPFWIGLLRVLGVENPPDYMVVDITEARRGKLNR